MSGNIDDRLLGRWQDSQRRQEAMRNYLARSELRAESFEGKTLDLIADAFLLADTARGAPSLTGTAALMSDDR